MPIDTKAADAALAAAEAAQAAAVAAQDGAEIAFLDTVKNLKQIAEGRTTHEANRLKSRYISVFGLERFTKLAANSR